MARLIALDLPGSPRFLDELRRAWNAGDAVLPVDPRLPGPARQALLDAARPHVVVGPDGRRSTGQADAPPLRGGDALVVATSGSTGAPKLVVHTGAGLAAHAEAVHAHLGVDPATDRWLACLPLAHIGGLGVVVRSVLTATPVDVLPGFDADVVGDAPRTLGSTLVSLVPTALDRIDPTGYRWIVLGGSADGVRRPTNVVRTYGLTETGGGIVYDDTALPGVELRIGSDDEIEVRGPMLARGLRSPDGEVVGITDDEGWFRTGDRGRLVATTGGPSRLEVHGRADDLIVTGGQNVWPAPVEAAIAEHPGVAEVAVVGRPDPEWGAAVVAVIVPRPGHPVPTLTDLRAVVRDVLPAYAAPKVVEVVDTLPRTPSGKVHRLMVSRGW
ncbi:MAG: AMP-binding protein [Actinobacteria bacterium]|nr:AMP-binding protein [Actinomycetota bacterium]